MSTVEMRVHRTADAVRYASMDTAGLRAAFMIESLFRPGAISLTLTDVDRAVVGSAVPEKEALALPSPGPLRAEHFCQRRELGVLNIGGAGAVTVDERTFDLAPRDALYVGRGARSVAFASSDAGKPAQFYLLSYPAHAAYPTTLIRHAEANVVRLGSEEEANRRTIHQYIHEEGVRSCQLVMGYTMPAHTHARRTEIYTYFDIPAGHRVFHLLGRPDETRHLCVADRCAVLSPGWSIHSGVGTTSYAFIWGMGGENQAFADMDGAGIDALR
jgi:4-deoxy-L-threo-5-hexosulose-uronate ketol-isomerase